MLITRIPPSLAELTNSAKFGWMSWLLVYDNYDNLKKNRGFKVHWFILYSLPKELQLILPSAEIWMHLWRELETCPYWFVLFRNRQFDCVKRLRSGTPFPPKLDDILKYKNNKNICQSLIYSDILLLENICQHNEEN